MAFVNMSTAAQIKEALTSVVISKASSTSDGEQNVTERASATVEVEAYSPRTVTSLGTYPSKPSYVILITPVCGVHGVAEVRA